MKEDREEGLKLIEKYKKCGIKSLNDNEIIKILLFYATTSNINANNLNNLNILDKTYDYLIKELNFNEVSAVFFNSIPKLAQICANEQQITKIGEITIENIKPYIEKKFIGVQNEIFYIFLFDDNLKLKAEDILAQGNENSIVIPYSKIVVKIAESGCKKVIVAHNHPSGNSNPSPNDIAVTLKLQKVLSTSGVDLIDHYIVSDSDNILSIMDNLKM